MDDFTAELKARELIASANPTTIPVPIKLYVERLGAVLRVEQDLDVDEPGWSFENNGKHYICVNAKDSKKRQRFTACHELAHIVLGLSSEHALLPWWSYAGRSANEICCDVFAAELLLPYRLFKPFVERAEVGLAAVRELADRFEASDLATGSRFATLASVPCAFVLSEGGRVRYASRSKSLREAYAWVPPKSALPDGSVSQRVRAGGECDGPEETSADVWFDNWDRGGTLLEDARHLSQWDQTMTLLWFEDEVVPPPKREPREEGEELGLKELDGTLPWPGKKRRR